MTIDVVAKMGSAANRNQDDSTVTRGTCGVFRGRRRGGHVSSHTLCTKNSKSDMTPLSDFPFVVNQTIDSAIPMISLEVEPSNCSFLDVPKTQIVGNF